ncbi:hypothetical protein GALMADRAFT_131855 [Galerina marginata CBS 339.88]|uniref:RNA helicase n=1 Tax=Galerina marginata (strain CBS 339.88) TaxID=685588 RepID=A0A067TPM3_GALM3|nr:hypothetical protein GALMADRAFT_131855 [Galerina marginata CBS 339.88]
MAKKKKTQLKPVERGFATTSLPKKNLPEVSLVLDSIPVEPSNDQSQTTRKEKEQDKELPSTNPVNANTDVQLAEEQNLQNLVDKLQEKTEKEISRTLKSIEVDRRFSQTLPRLDIDPILRGQIIAFALNNSTEAEGQKAIEDAEEKTLFRLGICYGVLRRIGFSEDRVEECMRNIGGIELDEAFDWLYLHCSEEELIFGKVEAREPKTLKLAAGITTRKHHAPPPTPRPQLEPAFPTKLVDDTARISDTAGIHPSYSKAGHMGISDFYDEVTDSISIVSETGSLPETIAIYDDQEDTYYGGDPTSAFVRLKLQQDEMSSKPSSRHIAEQLARLQQKLDDTTRDYLFDQKEALSRYHQERKQLDKRLLHEKLRSSTSDKNIGSSPTVHMPKKLPLKTTPPTASRDVFDDDDSDDSSTGMLGILDNPDPNEITVQGVTFEFRNMSVPKHWSGPMPKTLLRDFVTKADRHAAVSYTIISSHSRARRASVSVSWQNKTRDEWSMDEVACSEDPQAEQYVAAIALHSLMYPLTVGFIAPGPASTGGSTSFRLLPAVYRELWDELEASRKIRDDIINRKTWAKLLRVLEEKIKNQKGSEKQPKQVAEKQLSGVSRIAVENRGNFDSVSLAFETRRSSPAYQEMLAQRNELPISRYRDRIIDILGYSQVLVLSGETGCGKSTQVPSFILEDHLSKGKPCKIYCTEPRRISAISLAQRVAHELCDPPNSVGTGHSLVGYSIRLENNISRNTRLAFVTNGIALRMLEGGSGQGGNGTAFDEITHLIIDEVHERSIESDFLLIVLKTLLIERPDLKVILMSATVDADKVSSYFGNCETLQVPGRTFPVDVQYLEDAIEYTKWSISENSPYARRIHDKYYKGKNRPEWTEDIPSPDEEEEDDNKNRNLKLEKRYSAETATTLNTIDERLIPYDLILRLLEKICYEDQGYQAFSLAVLIFVPGLGEIRRLNDLLTDHPLFGSDGFKIYPLHSTLSSESQGAVFDVPLTGIRKIVIATNIAETGITIPDITCVIDTGKHREMRFDEKRQISRLVETFIARSNAAQRRGRAGRVRHGLCFHLFTKMRHDTQMADSPLPEMMRLSLSDLALRIKIMKVKLGTSIEDVLARALDPPVSINVQRAVSMLIEVGALMPSEEITPMGRLLSKLPTDVHLGKFLLVSTLFRCLDPALTIAATLNSKSPFVAPFGLEQEADRARNSFRIENSDFLTIHNAFSSWRKACANPGFARKFCRTNFLSHQNLQQIEDLRQQFLGYLIDSAFIQVDKSLVRELSRNDNRARYVRNRTRFAPIPVELDVNSNKPALIHAALAAGLYPKILSIDPKGGHMRTITNNQHASFHPSSVNFGKNPIDLGVNHLTYFTLMHSKKLYAWETGPVDDLCMVLLCGEADFKLVADIVSIDRKIKFFIPPKTSVALKILRERLTAILAQQYQGGALTGVQAMWMEIGLLALNRTKLAAEKDDIAIGIR